MQHELLNALEALVDKHTMYKVLHTLSTIAYCKADHCATNWQDEDLAESWVEVGEVIDKAIDSLPEDCNVSAL